MKHVVHTWMTSRKRARTADVDQVVPDFPDAKPHEAFTLVLHDRISCLEQQLQDLQDAQVAANETPRDLIASGCSIARVFAFRCGMPADVCAPNAPALAQSILNSVQVDGAAIVMCWHTPMQDTTLLLEGVLKADRSMSAGQVGRAVEQAGKLVKVFGTEEEVCKAWLKRYYKR